MGIAVREFSGVFELVSIAVTVKQEITPVRVLNHVGDYSCRNKLFSNLSVVILKNRGESTWAIAI